MKTIMYIAITLFALFLAANYCMAECIGRCGDVNDDGDVNVSDALRIINYVFEGGVLHPVTACGDANGDKVVNISDGVYIINYIFVGGSQPGDCSPGFWFGEDCCPFGSGGYFPLDLGNYWIYSKYSENVQWTVTHREGDIVHLDLGSFLNTIILRDRGEEIDIELVEGEWELYYRFVQGSMWIHRDVWECDDSTLLEVTLETGPIVTPAGEFHNCLRMERLAYSPCMDAGTMITWWAKGVGLVKWEEVTIAGPVTAELIEYSVAAK